MQSRLYLNNGTGTFTDATATRLPVANHDTASLAFGDVDGDGDLDLVLGNDGQSRLYLNNGTGTFTDATATRMPIGNDHITSLAPGDVDGDGDLDLVLGTAVQSRLYVNLGRQLDAPYVLHVGRTYSLDAYLRYGPSSAIDLAAVYLSTVPASIALPPFGTLGIDLAFAAPFPLLTIPQPAGVGTVTWNVPNVPSVIGQPFYSQALLVAYPNDLRLSNVVRDILH